MSYRFVVIKEINDDVHEVYVQGTDLMLVRLNHDDHGRSGMREIEDVIHKLGVIFGFNVVRERVLDQDDWF